MAHANLVGQSVGSYKVLAKIGEGGMGVVYLAQHPLLGKKAAIKVILPQYSSNPDHIARFHAEARAATLLRHPAFLNVFDFGQLPDGSAFLAMDLLEGRSLRERLEKMGKFPLVVALKIGRQMAAGMAVAHESGIIHRDLKPDNIFLELNPADRQTALVKILDFGVAKLIQPRDDTPVTQSGALLGTPLYMSPEQCRGTGGVDHRTDIYAWACLMFSMLLGRPPFDVEGFAAVIGAHAFKQPPRLRDLDAKMPGPVSALVDRCLAKAPSDRPASMTAVVQALDEIAVKLRCGPLTTGPTIGEVGLALGGDGKLPPASNEMEALMPGGAAPQTQRLLDNGTTLGHSASSVDHHERLGRPGGRRAAWLVVGLAVLGGALFVARKRTTAVPPLSALERPAPAMNQAPPPAPVAPDPTVPAPVVPAPAVPAVVGASAPVGAEAPRQQLVQIRTTPPGATVVEAATGQVVGESPLSLDLPAQQGPRRLLFSKPGYRPRSQLVVPGRDAEVKLIPLKPAAPRPRPAADPDERRKL